MGLFNAITGGNSKPYADQPSQRKKAAADLITGRSSKHNAEQRQDNVDWRKAKRKAKREERKNK